MQAAARLPAAARPACTPATTLRRPASRQPLLLARAPRHQHLGSQALLLLPHRPRTATAASAADELPDPASPSSLEPTPAAQPDSSPNPDSSAIVPHDESELVKELEVEELDAFQEQMLKWMALEDEEQQDDLDEMQDYDEFGDEEYEELYDEVEGLMEAADVELKLGDRVVGTVFELDDDGAYVEIGQKSSGFVPITECSFARLKTPLEVLRVGMTREFTVVEEEDVYDQVILSLAASEASIFWLRMRQMQEEDLTVTVKVESANRGGLLVKYGPYEGFLPVSQFGSQITPDSMEGLVGNQLPVKFLEVDEDKERLVFSNKRAAAALSANMQGFKTGDVCEGVVSKVVPYGAFLDLGSGVLGLLHVSQISHDRIPNIASVLQEGDRLKVMVLSMDMLKGRVSLSTKKLERTPGDMLRNPALVFATADETAAIFKQRLSALSDIAQGGRFGAQAGDADGGANVAEFGAGANGQFDF